MIINNFHDTATLTATSGALPIEYTQRSGRSKVWRSVDTAPQVIDCALPDPDFLSAVVVYNHNLTSAGTIRIEYLLQGDVVYDSGVIFASSLIPLGVWRAGVDPWGAQDLTEFPNTHHVVWTVATLATDYRITISDSNNPDGYVEVSRIIAGLAYSPKMNASYGVSLEWQDFAEHKRTEGNSLRTIGDGMARVLTFDLDYLEREGLGELSRELLKVGKRQDIYINLYPEKGGALEAEHAFVARRDGSYGHTHDYFNNWKTQQKMIEV
ncbi:hypothetical protein [Vreelandella nanhaiensis]|uniref:Uncharacterized protein n=1 Tax=Vreelandella nanhaiensis TaxID=1258546 RepID=A0A3S0Y062_9GAMM|nr:hypothetical protein [Halomonas nanhaiensis]RUR34467.1 hypothetical protein ELY38_02435 [Halomonas nanhaiensis]